MSNLQSKIKVVPKPTKKEHCSLCGSAKDVQFEELINALACRSCRRDIATESFPEDVTSYWDESSYPVCY